MRSKPALFVHGREPNRVHLMYADAIGADKIPVDFKVRWQDRPSPSKVRMALSWLVCAVNLARKKQDIIISESFREPVILLKVLGLSRKKVVLMLTNETAYMLEKRQLSTFTTWLYTRFLKKVDAIICISEMLKGIAERLSNESRPIEVIFNGIGDSRYHSFVRLTPNLETNNILIIAKGSSQTRVYCKGLDLMINAFAKINQRVPDANLYIIGAWEEAMQKKLLSKVEGQIRKAIHFVGHADNLEEFLGEASIYLHTARGESWGISILEAMRGGLIPLVSEWTGAKEVVEKVCQSLVVPLDEDVIAERVISILNLSLEAKKSISNSSRAITEMFSEEEATKSFTAAYNAVLKKIQ